MLRPRIIPCLLVHKGGLVKTQAFKDSKYVGDPINAVRIFNEKEADELMVPSMLGPTEHIAIPGDPPNHHGALLDSEAANTTDTNYTFVGYI